MVSTSSLSFGALCAICGVMMECGGGVCCCLCGDIEGTGVGSGVWLTLVGTVVVWNS